jgi:plastocyanin
LALLGAAALAAALAAASAHAARFAPSGENVHGLTSAAAAVTRSVPGRIAGTVTLTTSAAARRAASVYSTRSVAPKTAPVGPETRKVIVYLSDVVPAAPPSPMRATIVQRGEQFIPPVVAVTVGSTVAFPNDDPLFHNVFSLSRAKTFDLGRYPSGESREQRFARPGIVKVYCHIHSHMSALIRVFEHPWFAIPEESGAFELPDVPAGEHTLVAWHERIGERRERIVVEPGKTTTVSFTLPVLDEEP